MTEIKDVIMDTVEEMDNVEAVVEPVVKAGKTIKKVVGGVVTTVVVGGLGLAIAKKDKLKTMNDKRLVKKLTKRGYTVTMDDPDMEVMNYDVNDIDIPEMDE